jgi:uncharacterized membrane protein
MTVLLETSEAAAVADNDKVLVARAAGAARPRIDSIDLLRGLIMLLMALDHTRDFFGPGGMDVRNVADPGLFLTRWITHFCAPLFIFLAGTSAYLYGARGRTVGEVSRFLLTRGLWLIIIELTVVRLGWTFSFDLDFFVAQVIWAIGAAMVALAALVYLPRWAIAAVALVMIGGHNLLDGIRAEDWGAAGGSGRSCISADCCTLGPTRSSMCSIRSFPGSVSWPRAMRSALCSSSMPPHAGAGCSGSAR